MFKKFIVTILPYVPKKIVCMFSRRYIVGETVEDALKESLKLNSKGITVTVDILGEYITKLKDATKNKEAYISLIKRFTAEKINGNFSVKPSMFGLLLDKNKCYSNLREIVGTADKCNTFIRIDMEDSGCTNDELSIFTRLRKEFPSRVGIAIQAYLRRTLEDIENLLKPVAGVPLNCRLCKGIYIEPENIALQEHQEIRDNFIRGLELMLSKEVYVGIATHDKYIIEKAYELIDKYNIAADKYEFQMLYGVTPELRKTVVNNGHSMRVYLPYGREWFAYSVRRLKENPNIAWHIIKALFVKG